MPRSEIYFSVDIEANGPIPGEFSMTSLGACVVGRQIFEEILAVASGKKTLSELAGVGEEEFSPWIIGPIL